MTVKRMKEKGLKCIFLKEDTKDCRKWDLIVHFKYLNKETNNFVYEHGIDMKIYFYNESQCFVNIDCMKRINGRNQFLTIQELIEYENFFNHIFEIDEYME